MINNAQLTAVLPVVDVNRAAGFYRDRLGLKDLGVDTTGNNILLSGAGSQIALMPAGAGAQSSHTVLTFEVENIAQEIKELEGRGVAFLDYDLPDLKTTNHVAVLGSEKGAWFADTEGNILCLHENPEGSATR